MAGRRRKHTLPYYVVSISRQVWAHPANRRRRLRALLAAAGWQVRRRLSRRSPIAVLPGGAHLYCYADSTVVSQLFYFGSYAEYDELLFLCRYLRAGDGVVDGGANVGLYTLHAAPLVGADGRVDAFEPGREAGDRLEANVALNGYSHVQVHRAALWDAPTTLGLSTGWDVSNRVTDGEGQLVAALSLDDTLAGRSYAYAKLDVEGAEHRALTGALARLADHDPPVWQVEVFGSMLQQFGSSAGQVASLLREHGYALAAYDADTNRLRRLHAPTGAKNLLAIAEERWSWVADRLVESAYEPGRARIVRSPRLTRG